MRYFMSSKHWETIWHPFRAIEVHYNEDGWKRLSEGRLKAWPSFGEVKIDKEIDWDIDPFNNKTWKLYFHSLNWTYSYLWGIDNDLSTHAKLHDVLSQYIDYLQSENTDEMAWFDHTTSDRLCAISAIILHPSSKHMAPDLLENLNKIIGTHITKICEYYDSEFWFDSNHGVFHALALINISHLYSVGPNDENVRSIGVDYLKISLKGILSIDEGISLEQSAYYHQLAIELVDSIDETYLEMVGIYKNEFIEKMTEANYWFTSSNRKLIPIGDTSVISKASKKHMPVNAPKEFLKTYLQGGISIVKQESADGVNHFAMLHREKRAPHGHYDALSVILEHNNHRFLVDSGGPYEYGTKLRYEYFMSSFAHNVLLVNNNPHQSGAKFLRANKIEEGVFLIEAEHQGYDPMIHNRTCVMINDVGLIIIDELRNVTKETKLEFLWHLDPKCSYDVINSIISNENQNITYWSSEEISANVNSNEDSMNSWVTDKISSKIESKLLINTMTTSKDKTVLNTFGYNGKIECEISGNNIKCVYNDTKIEIGIW